MATQQPNLITLTDPDSPASEAFRTLRTNLEFVALSRDLQAIVVTAPALEEAKSTTVANLGVTCAQSGRSVIIVDADMRRPRQQEIFGLNDGPGLSNALLSGEGAQAPPLRETGIRGLRLLTAGMRPPNPAELLISTAMSTLVEKLRQQAEVILFDTPPVVPVTDGALLGARVDGVLLVIQAGKTTREHAARARTLLDQVGATIIGTALTNAKVDRPLTGY